MDKYTKQLLTENLLLKKILNVTIIEPHKDLLAKMYTGEAKYDKELNSLLQEGQKSLMDNQSVFDTLISNILGTDNIRGLQVLTTAYHGINEEKDKTINNEENIQKFLTFFKEIILNYIVLVMTNPDLFPTMLPQSPDDDEGIDLSVWRFWEILENGFSSELLNLINGKHKLI